MLFNRDKVKAFHGSWGSGIATLEFESGRSIFCDNGETARSLRDARIAAILPDHCLGIVPDSPDIVWFEDDFGLLLGGFALYDDWLDAGLPAIVPGLSINYEPQGESEAG